jgi:hypothetical protein
MAAAERATQRRAIGSRFVMRLCSALGRDRETVSKLGIPV